MAGKSPMASEEPKMCAGPSQRAGGLAQRLHDGQGRSAEEIRRAGAGSRQALKVAQKVLAVADRPNGTELWPNLGEEGVRRQRLELAV
jgi:hypothetical protein